MKQPSLAAALLATVLCTAAVAQPGIPQRQSGLWTTAVDGRDTGMSLCVDRARDDVMTHMLPSESGKAQCSRSAPQRESADRVVLESVCQTGDQKKTVRMVFTGDFERQVTADISTTFDPPRKGRAPRSHRFEMRWVGACPAGVQPGQMLMPGARPAPAR